MRIGIDIDDTLTNFSDQTMAYGQKYDFEVLKRNSLQNLNGYDTPEIFNWTKEEDKEFWDRYIFDMTDHVLPRQFAVDVIVDWKSKGYEIYIITARSDMYFGNAYNRSENWLQKNNIPYDYLIANCDNKGDVAKKLNLDVFIDDKPKNCMDISLHGIPTLMMDARFNQTYQSEGVIRVYSWSQISYEVSKIVESKVA